MDNEKELSEKNRPSYIKWAWSDKKHRLTLLGGLVGIVACGFATPALIDGYKGGAALVAIICGFIAIYGFTIGMFAQPYSIYRKLRRLNYWSKNSPWKK